MNFLFYPPKMLEVVPSFRNSNSVLPDVWDMKLPMFALIWSSRNC